MPNGHTAYHVNLYSLHRDNIDVAVGGTFAYAYTNVPSSTVAAATNEANVVVIDATYVLDNHSLATLYASLLYVSAALNTGHINEITLSDIELAVQSSGLIIDTSASTGAFGRRHLLQTLPAFAIATPSAAFAQGFAEDVSDKLGIPEEDVTVAFVMEAQGSSTQFEVILSVHLDRCRLCDLSSSQDSSGGSGSSGSGSLSNSESSELAAAGRKMLASPSVDSTGSSSDSSECFIEGYYTFDGFRFHWVVHETDLSHPPNSPCTGGSSASSTGSSSDK